MHDLSSLRAKVLQSLIAQPVHASNIGEKSTPAEWGAPLCPSLRRFGLKYHRWLRPSEHFDLIPNLVSVILSRERSNCPLQSFWVWMGSDQKDLLDLIEQSRISFKQIERSVDKSGIKVENVLEMVLMRLMQVIFGPPDPSKLTVPLLPMKPGAAGGRWEVTSHGQTYGCRAGRGEGVSHLYQYGRLG